MTELVWDGKYDGQGRRVAPPRIALPFQTVETVNESATDRLRNLEMFAGGRESEWRNRLIWGDKKYVLPSLLEEFGGKVDLIYVDPPFATGGDFSFTANVPQRSDNDQDESLTFLKEPSVIEQKAYRDTWGRGLDGYVQWLYGAALGLRELLRPTGSLYVHLGPSVSSYAKAILDEVFGIQNALGEIVWQRTSAHANVGRRYATVTERILFYVKSSEYTWQPVYQGYSKEYLQSHYSLLDENGRAYTLRDLTASMSRASASQIYEWRGVRPTASRCWSYTKDNMDRLFDEGRVVFTTGKMPRLRLYLDEMRGSPASDLWDDIAPINSQSPERVNYPTQKPEALLERIIKASSTEGDLVLDCFAGSGTTAAAAEKLGRRWIASDLGRFAIHTTRKRLLGISGVKPFVVQNLGKYERQAWQAAEFGALAEAQTQAYREFILRLYRAEPISGYVWLHGNRRGRMVHIGAVDAPVTMADVTAIIAELRRAVGRGKDAPTRSGVDILGWDFAFELNETARQQAALAGIDVHLVRIPREVLEKKAVEQGDIRFFELAALSVDVKKKAKSVKLELIDFVIPLDEVPDDVQRAVKHWEQWIDYWAVDWDHAGGSDTFHNEWQTYRTRKQPKLERTATHRYESSGSYRVLVKVIDILGNDSTKAIPVVVK